MLVSFQRAATSYILNNPLAGTDPTGYIACKEGIKESCDAPEPAKTEPSKRETASEAKWRMACGGYCQSSARVDNGAGRQESVSASRKDGKGKGASDIGAAASKPQQIQAAGADTEAGSEPLPTHSRDHQNDRNVSKGTKDDYGTPKPPGDFVLVTMHGKRTWIHRSALNAVVLDHKDNQNSHIATGAGANAAGFVLFGGKSDSAQVQVDTSGRACRVIQDCMQLGVGGFFGGGAQYQASIQRGPTASGETTTHGAFISFGAVKAFGASVDVSADGFSAAIGGKGAGIGAAAGYQQCNISTVCK